ncbi:hypothetical protein [Ectopseudomonas oleovorans]|uniref:Uncharacterized protein n=1 Tax=Ectopseudomonas oleovorans TaxID=301 RepID=A0AA42TXG5_ECTOL|nr:hypothetical protein [Pseudomonas oleovorans]MDH1339841.1 hypothetical protein [Pseudomonas oleovorans]MDH1492691.1 hypothetical protein [Pseudomonas oleovorans]WGG21714.1 hypothetical protein N5O83_03160 [Pseudomonas oleovorans]
MNSLIAWAAWLEATALGEQMRSSALLYPALNLLHLLGLVLLLVAPREKLLPFAR